MRQHRAAPWYARPAIGLVGLGFLSVGLVPLLKGAFFRQTYWGGAAFAPVEVVVGAFAIYLATFGWRRMEGRGTGNSDKRRKDQ